MKKVLIGLMVFVLLTSLFSVSYGGNKRNKRYKKETRKKVVSITQLSKLKKYNPNATWKRVSCKKCNGTGTRTRMVTIYKKHNKVEKVTKPCYYCKGKGTRGMSKM